jgi:hypothetical protein
MHMAKERTPWPHDQVFELYYTDIICPIDRISGLARAVISWTYGHEDNGNISAQDMHSLVVLADYIVAECGKVRSLEQRVMDGPHVPQEPVSVTL